MISNWRNELREIVDEIEPKAAKKVKETKGINNKIVINPKLAETVEEIGGELIEMKEVDDEDKKDDPSIKQKEKQASAMKKRVLLAKLRAVRSGGGSDIMASYQPEIEHSKMGDAKKKADKKKESKLPPHLQGDALGKMKKAFSQEGYRVLAKGDDGKRAQFSYKDEKDAKKFASTFKKATVTKEEVVVGEAVKGADREMRKMAAQDRLSGKEKRLSPSKSKANVAKMVKDIKYFQKLTKEEVLAEKSLTAGQRRALPDSDFVFPGKGEGPEGKQTGAYPINDKKRARAALSMAAAYASPEKEAKVKAAVKKKFPGIQQEENALEKRAKENEKARKFLKKDAKDSGYTDIALKASMSKGAGVSEAKVEAGRSDYGKASVRNKRKFGKEGEPAVFDASGERGKMIDKRREEHKAKRGVSESAMTLIGRSRKKVEKKPEKAMDAGSKARRSMKRREHAKYVSGSTDNVPDDIREEDKALNFVLDKIRKEVGKDGYVSKNNPRKPQSASDKAKVRAHQAKVDAENAAERKKDPSQGRYPKG